MFDKFNPKRKIFLILSLIAYIGCMLILIVEAAMPGNISSDQSNAIGGGIADIVNENAGDQSEIILPTSVKFNEPEKNTLYVGETLSLEVVIEPENSSFKSLTYTTSSEEILAVDSEGKLQANASGEAIITVFSTSYPELQDSLKFLIKNIEEESITSLINAEKNEKGHYVLEAGKSYPIQTTFEPENTTIKTLTYQASCDSSILSVSQSGTLYPVKESTSPILVTVTSNNMKTSQFSVVIKENKEDIIPLQEISLSQNDYIQSIGESINLQNSSVYKITFTPSKATYRTFRIEVEDSSIASVSNTSVKGLKEGETTLKVISDYDENIFATRTLRIGIVELNSISKILVGNSTSPKLIVGESKNVTYQGAKPSNATAVKDKASDHILYKSSNPSVLTVNNSGKVTAVSAGTCKVSVYFFNRKEEKNAAGENPENYAVKKEIDVVVENPPEPEEISTFSLTDNINESKEEGEHVLFLNKQYSLSTGIKIDKFYNSEGVEVNDSTSKELTYTLESKYPEDASITLDGTTLNTTSSLAANINIKVVNSATGLSEILTYDIIEDFKMQYKVENPEDEPRYSNGLTEFQDKSYPTFDIEPLLHVNNSIEFKFGSLTDDQISYRYSFREEEDTSLYNIASETKDTLRIRALDEGLIKILITPCKGETSYLGMSKVLTLSLRHTYVERLTLNLYQGDSTEKLDLTGHIDEEGRISMTFYVKSKIKTELLSKPDNVTKKLVDVAYDSEYLTKDNDFFILKKVGKTNITFKDKFTDTEVNLTLFIRNKVELDQEQPFTLTQRMLSYDQASNTYHIENGTVAKIKTNFAPESTYKTVHYSSSDEEVLQVGDDGNITPLKVGEATITASIDDGDSIHISYNVKIIVDQKNLISNLGEFFYKVRKGLGHFGAFLITGIFSTLFFLFVVSDKKLYAFTIPFNFIQGLFLAELTEFIQLFTPGRCGAYSDVLIDFTGFCCSVVFITILELLIVLIKFLIRYYRKKKANQYEQQFHDKIK